MKNKILFDVIRNDDLSPENLERQRKLILNASCNNEKLKKQIIEDLEILFKIAQCKYTVGEMLKTQSIFDIVAFLESNYYNRDILTEKANNVLRFMFTPLYYKDEEYELVIAQEFWITPLGKLIVSCLTMGDDILISTTEAGEILGYKRQHMRNLAVKGKLTAIKIGGGNQIFKLMDVLTYKKSRNY